MTPTSTQHHGRGHEVGRVLGRLGRRFLAWRDARRYARALESDVQSHLDKMVWGAVSRNNGHAEQGVDEARVGYWLSGELDRLPTDQLEYIEARTRHESEIAVDKIRDTMILRRSKIETALARRNDAQIELDELAQPPLEEPGDPDRVARRFEAQHELLGHRSRVAAARQSGVFFLLLGVVVLVFEAILVYLTLTPVFEDTVSRYLVTVATISCSIGMLVLAHVGFFTPGRLARVAGRSGLFVISLVLATVRVGVMSRDVRVDATSIALELAFFLTMIAIAWLGARLSSEAIVRIRNAERMARTNERRVEALQALLDATGEQQRQANFFTSVRASRVNSRGAQLQDELANRELEFHREEAAGRRVIQNELQQSLRRLQPVLRNTAKQLARQKYGLGPSHTSMTEDTNAKSHAVVDLVR